MTLDKKVEHNNIETYLHQELIFDILVRLPADDLHKSMRYVCKAWANLVIDPLFIEAHLLRANTGLFVESVDYPSCASFFEIKAGEFRMTELKGPFPGRMISSCDGVALFTDPIDHRCHHVANLVTKEVVTLPNLDVPHNLDYFSSSIARISLTGEFKVVHAYEYSNKVCHWLLFTVGVDNSWRQFDFCPAYEIGLLDMDCFPVSAGGVIYWIDFDIKLDGLCYFLALDMGDETFHKVPISSGRPEPLTYLKLGNYLSSFRFNQPNAMQFEVQILKDLRQGEWIKLYMINLDLGGDSPCDVFCVYPIAWLNADQILILDALTSRGNLLLAYHVKTRETTILEVGTSMHDFSQCHTNSLVSWKTPNSLR